MQKLKKFFWACSGADMKLLEECPTEASKYVGIGGTVLFTGLFAALSAGYALYTVFDNVILAIIFGLFWGLMIFNLDRFIVSSMRKTGKSANEWLVATPRIILAVFISLVIAKPLELKIFEKEIEGELTIMNQEHRAQQENEINSRYAGALLQNKQEITSLKGEMTTKAARRDELRKIAQQEADGTGGTKKRNAGPIYAIKKADADRADKELKELSDRNTELINGKLSAIALADSSALADILALEKTNVDGPAARLEALDRITAISQAIWIANLFIILLFLAVETAPIFVKLISPIGPYDHLLKEEEHKFFSHKTEALAKVNAETKDRSDSLPSTEKDYVTNRLDMDLQQS